MGCDKGSLKTDATRLGKAKCFNFVAVFGFDYAETRCTRFSFATPLRFAGCLCSP